MSSKNHSNNGAWVSTGEAGKLNTSRVRNIQGRTDEGTKHPVTRTNPL